MGMRQPIYGFDLDSDLVQETRKETDNVQGKGSESMEQKDAQKWLEGYIEAWESNDPDDIGRIFTVDAQYFTAPYRQPWSGREQIISGWLGRKDEPGDYEFEYEILGLSEDTAFIRGWTKYPKQGAEYSNLWLVRLDDQGQCYEFIEWWMQDE
jgi:hypothetical protein